MAALKLAATSPNAADKYKFGPLEIKSLDEKVILRYSENKKRWEAVLVGAGPIGSAAVIARRRNIRVLVDYINGKTTEEA